MMISKIKKFTLILLTTMVLVPKLAAQTFEYPECQDNDSRFSVNFQGNRPTIIDFATAFLNYIQKETFYDNVNREWNKYLKKKPLSPHVSISVDVKNGYMRYDIVNPVEKDTTFMEMCFWNCADGKHRLIAANTVWLLNGNYGWAEHTGTRFFVYDNKTRVMRDVYAEDISALYDGDGLTVFFLPRKGKNIRVSAAGAGDRWDEILIWDGYKFSSKRTE